MGYISLESYYETVFSMIQHHKWSITEIENLIPWERDVYVQMLSDHLKEQAKKNQAEAMGAK
tara:strand:- start:19605 stop:19790 length:186 start_codon:yes stop_codon:yes gene_type:complete